MELPFVIPESFNWLSVHDIDMILRLLLATFLGGVVGIERGSGDKPAGFRTHILVCTGSALIMLVSMYGFDTNYSDGSNRDSARIAAQVVSGIGFLGAGTIIHEGVTIRGLTTAASLWMVSAIGLAAGAGMYVLSIASTAIMLITLITFHSWEKRFAATSKSARRYIRLVVENDSAVIPAITAYLAESKVKVRTMNITNNSRGNEMVVELYLKMSKDLESQEVITGLQSISGVISLENIG